MICVGIDPGKSGGVSVIGSTGTIFCNPYSDDNLIYMLGLVKEKQQQGSVVKVCVEKVNAMPGQGVVSMFNFGKSLGFIEGVLQSMALPYQLVPPQTWKKEFSLTGTKQASIDVCRKLFPSVDLLATQRSRKEHDGMAESLLMAEYARRRL